MSIKKELNLSLININELYIKDNLTNIFNYTLLKSDIFLPEINTFIYFDLIFSSFTNNSYIFNDDGNINIMKNSNFIIKFKIDNIEFIQHNGSITLGLYIDDILHEEYIYNGPGFINPSYGYKTIYYSATILKPSKIKIKIINSIYIKNITIISAIKSMLL